MKRGAFVIVFLLIIPFAAGFLDFFTGNAVACVPEVVCGMDGVTYEDSCGIGVKVAHMGKCAKNEFIILYRDPDTQKLKFWESFNPESIEELFSVDYIDTKGDNFVVSKSGMKDGMFKLRIDLAADEGYPGKGKDYIHLYWNISDRRVQSLGAASGNVSDLEIEAVMGDVGKEELMQVNRLNESLMTRYGAIIETPSIMSLSDKFLIRVPSDSLKATLSFSDKAKNKTLYREVAPDDVLNEQFTHKEFPEIKDENLVYGNKSYHFYERVVVKDGPVPRTNMMAKDPRLGSDVFLKLNTDNLIYTFVLVSPFDFNQLNSSVGLKINLLGNDMTIYEAQQATGKLILDAEGKIRPYYDKDPFVTEMGNDSKWVWDINIMPKIQLGVKNEKEYLGFDDGPVKVGECYEFPYKYFSVCFDNISIDNYLDLRFDVVEKKDFSSVFSQWGNMSAIKVYTGSLKSLKLKSVGFTIQTNEVYIFPAGGGVKKAVSEEKVEGVAEDKVDGGKEEVVKEAAEEEKGFGWKNIKTGKAKKYLSYTLIILVILLIVDIVYRFIKNRNV